MKQHVVMEINEKQSVLMETGGAFRKMRARPGWQPGDLVYLPKKNRTMQTLSTTAACFILLLLSSFAVFYLQFEEATIISMDINPSIELSVNRLGTVLHSRAYNEDGEALLAQVELTGQPYLDAIAQLMKSSPMQGYILANDSMDISVYAGENAGTILSQVEETVFETTKQYKPLALNCRTLSHDQVKTAHRHRMTGGRYLALLELQTVLPDADIESYSHCSIGEIRDQIGQQRQHRMQGADGSGETGACETAPCDGSHGHGQLPPCNVDTSESEAPAPSPQGFQQEGHRNGAGPNHENKDTGSVWKTESVSFSFRVLLPLGCFSY